MILEIMLLGRTITKTLKGSNLSNKRKKIDDCTVLEENVFVSQIISWTKPKKKPAEENVCKLYTHGLIYRLHKE